VADVLKNDLQLPQYSLFGIFNYQVVLSGMAGGISRGLVEAPTDFFKVRRQVEQRLSMRAVLSKTSVTLHRNKFLCSGFVIYMDLSKQLCHAGLVPGLLTVPDGSQLTPFWKGAICANLAWLTVWPGDVVKTQRQSGNYEGVSSLSLLKENIATGRLYKGVLPGLARSTIANGTSMVVYEMTHVALSQHYRVGRKDVT
jgi:hypothetical protein